jgi:SAM-dependent methyltransferase
MNGCICCSNSNEEKLFPIESHMLVRCKTCGLEKITPQPTDETLSSIYGQHYYNAWGLDKFEELVGRQKRATFGLVLDKLGTPPPWAKLLDCGAATGYLMEAAKDRGYTPYGVELSEFGARTIADKFGLDRVHNGELDSAHFPSVPDGQFDVVTMCDFLEHVRDPVSVLEKAHLLLAPGGRLVITTPNRAGISRTLMGRKWSQYKLEHLYYFNPSNIAGLLERQGFSNTRISPAAKEITLKYVFAYFARYRHPVVTPLAEICKAILPDRVQERLLTLVLGDMLVIAEKTND